MTGSAPSPQPPESADAPGRHDAENCSPDCYDLEGRASEGCIPESGTPKSDGGDSSDEIALQQRAAHAFAGASAAALAEHWASWPDPPSVEYLRGPETGLVMVQGRLGGSGDRFNLGEATVVRATALLSGGPGSEQSVGTSYLLGSDVEHAGLAAIFAALLSDESKRDLVLERVIKPLEQELASADARSMADAHATSVNFFTVARENAGGIEEDDEE